MAPKIDELLSSDKTPGQIADALTESIDVSQLKMVMHPKHGVGDVVGTDSEPHKFQVRWRKGESSRGGTTTTHHRDELDIMGPETKTGHFKE